MKILSILSVLILMCTAVVANAQLGDIANLVAFDDFSSADKSGGFGWAGDWSEDAGAPVAMTFSSANPLSNGVSAGYYNKANITSDYPHRILATPLQASTTPEVWGSAYLRPNTMPNDWQFGMQLFDTNPDGSNNYDVGAMSGLMVSNNDVIQLANSFAANRVNDGTSGFTEGQETLLVMRFYKNDPADTEYNRVDLYADLDGTDGLYNNEVAIATNYDLLTFATPQISLLRVNQSGFDVDWDFFAIGTTKASVTPEPMTISLLGLGTLLIRRKRS